MTLFLLVYASCLLLSLSDPASLTARLSSRCFKTDSGHLQKFQEMSEVLPNVDPKAALSTVDLVKLLLNHCNSNKEEGKKREEAEIVHTDNKIKAVIDGFGKQLSNVIVAINLYNSDQADRIKDLELKLETQASYQEQLLYSLRSVLQETKVDLKKHKDSCHVNTPVLKCESCDQSFQTIALYEEHICSYNTSRILFSLHVVSVVLFLQASVI